MELLVESNLSIPLSGSLWLRIHPKSTAKDVLRFYLGRMDDEIQGGLVVLDHNYKQLDWTSTLESQGVTEGSIVHIGCKRDPRSYSLHISIVAAMALVTAASLLITSSVLFSTTGGTVPFDFGIVIDAGSAHTEAFLYEWHGSKVLGTGQVLQKDSCNVQVGIAVAPDPALFISCVNNISRSLPINNRAPLYLAATGGMRLLNITYPKDAKLILLTLKYALKSTSAQIKEIGIISGKHEGVFSWITTNFLMKVLQPTFIEPHWNITYGALDLGGASTQYSYAIDKRNLNSSDIEALKLYGYTYHVESRSFLCFGVSQAFYRHEILLIKDLNETTIYDPCLPKQFYTTVKIKDLFSSPCVYNNLNKDWILDDDYMELELNITGTSNYSECKAKVSTLLNEVDCKEIGFHQCIQSTNIANTHRKFMAFSSFYYITNFLNSTNASLNKFIQNTEDWCSKTWNEIKVYEDSESYAHIDKYCFGAIYVTEFLNSVYGFSDSSWKNIIFQQKVNDTELGWALGYMINATNAIPAELPSLPVLSNVVFSLLVVVSICLAVIGAALIYKKFMPLRKGETTRLIEEIY